MHDTGANRFKIMSRCLNVHLEIGFDMKTTETIDTIVTVTLPHTFKKMVWIFFLPIYSKKNGYFPILFLRTIT